MADSSGSSRCYTAPAYGGLVRMIRSGYGVSKRYVLEAALACIRPVMERPRQAALLCCVALFAFNPIGLTAQNDQVPPELYSSLRWRLIGPFRGGRVTSVCGVPGDHSTYYAGTPGGGVW